MGVAQDGPAKRVRGRRSADDGSDDESDEKETAADSGERTGAPAKSRADTPKPADISPGAPGAGTGGKRRKPSAAEIRAMIADGAIPLVDESAIDPAPTPVDMRRADVGTLLAIVNNRSEQHTSLVAILRRGQAFRALGARDDVDKVERRRGAERGKFVVLFRAEGALAERDIQLPVHQVLQAQAMVDKVERVCVKLGIDEAAALRLAARVDTAVLDEVLRERGSHSGASYILYRDFESVVEAVHGIVYGIVNHELPTAGALDASLGGAPGRFVPISHRDNHSTRESGLLPVARGSPVGSPMGSPSGSPMLRAS